VERRSFDRMRPEGDVEKQERRRACGEKRGGTFHIGPHKISQCLTCFLEEHRPLELKGIGGERERGRGGERFSGMEAKNTRLVGDKWGGRTWFTGL
jgi:hypothetical protein